ncbi:lysylphosphatidylglycerol synthase transmembrane domain-containing protein [Corynebacterium aquilae]|uniref:lysylphosphatidylglycerol synthase transmembrane domain-containing protein n=1 Tax=Corynebacterium aquilae TaxID=203263 RepID=UPI000951DF8A|nr:YbhN family protein [Corynebacterium aquilae]
MDATRSNTKRAKAAITTALPFVVVAAMVFFVWRYHALIAQAFHEIRGAEPAVLPLTVVGAAVSMYAMGYVTHSLLYAGDVKVSTRNCVHLALASNAWSASLPGGQAFAAMLSFTVMRSWGASALVCSWQIVLSAVLSSTWLVALGVVTIFVLGASLSLSSLGLSLLGLSATVWAVYYIAHHPHVLRPLARWGLGMVNRVRRAPAGTGLSAVEDHISRLDAVYLSPKRFAATAAASLLNWLGDVVVLWACVWAVSGAMPLWEARSDETTIMGVVLAFVTAKIAGTVQATPGGIGPVEAALTGTLVAAGLPATTALGAVLIFRLVTFFGLVAIGWVVYAAKYASIGKSLRAGKTSTPGEVGYEAA